MLDAGVVERFVEPDEAPSWLGGCAATPLLDEGRGRRGVARDLDVRRCASTSAAGAGSLAPSSPPSLEEHGGADRRRVVGVDGAMKPSVAWRPRRCGGSRRCGEGRGQGGGRARSSAAEPLLRPPWPTSPLLPAPPGLLDDSSMTLDPALDDSLMTPR